MRMNTGLSATSTFFLIGGVLAATALIIYHLNRPNTNPEKLTPENLARLNELNSDSMATQPSSRNHSANLFPEAKKTGRDEKVPNNTPVASPSTSAGDLEGYYVVSRREFPPEKQVSKPAI